MKKYYNHIAVLLTLVIVASVVSYAGYQLYSIMTQDVPVIKEDETGKNVFVTTTPVTPVTEPPENNVPVVAVEKFRKPFAVSAQIAKPFFDYNQDLAVQVSAVTYFEGVYRPNIGVDYSYNQASFNVTAAISGYVSDVYDDSLFGQTVVVSSNAGYIVTYQSLGDVFVKVNDQVLQGDLLATASENKYNPELGKHVHVVVEKDDMYHNLESLLSKPVQ